MITIREIESIGEKAVVAYLKVLTPQTDMNVGALTRCGDHEVTQCHKPGLYVAFWILVAILADVQTTKYLVTSRLL
jgi:hypothetical protein